MDSNARKHLRAIATAFDQEAQERGVDASALGVLDRMRRGFELGTSAVFFPELEAELDKRAKEQAQLHARWRALVAARK